MRHWQQIPLLAAFGLWISDASVPGISRPCRSNSISGIDPTRHLSGAAGSAADRRSVSGDLWLRSCESEHIRSDSGIRDLFPVLLLTTAADG